MTRCGRRDSRAVLSSLVGGNWNNGGNCGRYVNLNNGASNANSNIGSRQSYHEHFFANFFLNDFDHWLKQDKKVKHYVRYMDDMVIFGSNKRALHKLRKEIQEELQKIGLELKPNWQVYRLDKEPLDFMGFRFYRNRTVLRKSIMLRISRRVSRAAKRKQPTRTDAFAIVSYMGWIKCTDTNGFYEKWIKPKVDFNQLKNMIRSYSKNENVQKRKRQQAISVGQDILRACGIPQL